MVTIVYFIQEEKEEEEEEEEEEGGKHHRIKTMTFSPSFYFIGKKVVLTIKPTGGFSFHL